MQSETAGISSMERLSPVVSSLVGLGEGKKGSKRVSLRLGSSIYTGSKPKPEPKLINWLLTNQVLMALFDLPQVYESPHTCCLDNTQLISLSVKTQKVNWL